MHTGSAEKRALHYSAYRLVHQDLYPNTRSKNVAEIRVIEGLTVGISNIHTTVLIYTQETIIVEK